MLILMVTAQRKFNFIYWIGINLGCGDVKKVKKALMLYRGEVWRQVNMVAKFLDPTKSFLTETAICIVRDIVFAWAQSCTGKSQITIFSIIPIFVGLWFVEIRKFCYYGSDVTTSSLYWFLFLLETIATFIPYTNNHDFIVSEMVKIISILLKMARNSFTVVRLEINQKAKLKEARIS